MPGWTGSGAAIVFATSSFVGKYREIGELMQEREAVDSTTLDIAKLSPAQNIPGDNPSGNQVRCRIRWQGTQTLVPFAAPETITITPAKEVSGSATPMNVAGTGYIVSRRMLPNLQRNQLNEGEFVIQFDGVTGPTHTPEA